MSYQTLLTSLEENIFIITINRPEKLNALNKIVIEELSKAIDEVYNNTEIKSAIITGAGEKAFVAGADISEFLPLDQKAGEELARKGQQNVFDKIENSHKPIIAAVNGFALGGGLELAMACHIRIAAESAKMGFPEVSLGLIPGYGGTQRLTRLIGRGRALELILTADMITAGEGYQFGLINHVVSHEGLLPKAMEILNKILLRGPLAVASAIAAVNAASQPGVNGFEVEIDGFAQCFGTNDFREGVAAFLQRRKPVFKGK